MIVNAFDLGPTEIPEYFFDAEETYKGVQATYLDRVFIEPDILTDYGELESVNISGHKGFVASCSFKTDAGQCYGRVYTLIFGQMEYGFLFLEQDKLSERFHVEIQNLIESISFADSFPEEGKYIRFKNFDWYTTVSEVSKEINLSYCNTRGVYYPLNNIYLNSNWFVENGGCSYKTDLTIAGYIPSETKVCFIYPITDDGIRIEEVNKAELFLVMYSFYSSDITSRNSVEDPKAVYEDLKAKLNSVYYEETEKQLTYEDGDIFTGYNTISWKDDKGIIVLCGSDSSTHLLYYAADANERLDQSHQISLEQEAIEKAIKAEQEEQKRQENKDNVDGL